MGLVVGSPLVRRYRTPACPSSSDLTSCMYLVRPRLVDDSLGMDDWSNRQRGDVRDTATLEPIDGLLREIQRVEPCIPSAVIGYRRMSGDIAQCVYSQAALLLLLSIAHVPSLRAGERNTSGIPDMSSQPRQLLRSAVLLLRVETS